MHSCSEGLRKVEGSSGAMRLKVAPIMCVRHPQIYIIKILDLLG